MRTLKNLMLVVGLVGAFYFVARGILMALALAPHLVTW